MTVDVAVRMGLQGGSQVSKTLQEVGRDGQRSLRQIREAAKELPPHLRVVSAGIGQMKDGVDDLVSRTGSLGGAVAGLGPVGMALTATFAAVAAGAVAATGAIVSAAQAAAELTDRAAELGVGVETLQAWRYAADEAGVGIDSLESSFSGLNTSIGTVKTGLRDALNVRAFAQLGISREEVQSWQSLDEALPKIAGGLTSVSDRAARIRLAEQIGVGDAILLFERGEAGAMQLLDAARDAGVVIGEDLVSAGDVADRQIELQMQRMQTSVQTFGLEGARAVGPVIGAFNDLLDVINRSLAAMRQFWAERGVGESRAARQNAARIDVEEQSRRLANLYRRREELGQVDRQGGGVSGREGFGRVGWDAGARRRERARIEAEISQGEARLRQRQQVFESALAPVSTPQITLPPVGGGSGAPSGGRSSAGRAPRSAPSSRAAGPRRDPEADSRREAEADKRLEDQLARVREASIDSERELADAIEVVNTARARGIIVNDADSDSLKAVLAARLADAKTLEALDGIYDGLESSTRAYIEATQAELGSREAATAGHAINLELLADERAALYEAAGLTEDYAQAMGLSKEALDALRAPLDENIAAIIRAQRAYAAGEIDLAALTEQTMRYGRALDGATQASQRQIEAAQQVEGLRRGNETPEERMARELRELDALRTASSGGPGAMTQADYDRERRRIEDDARRAREGTDAARIRDQIATPEQRRDRERAELDRIYRDSQGAPGAMTEDEYARAGKAIEDSYLRAAEAIRGATLEQRILNGVLDQSINSGEDLLRVILEWVKAQAMLALRNPEGQGGSFLDRFLGNLGSNGTSGGGFSIPGFGGGTKQVGGAKQAGGAGGGLGALAGMARNAASVFSSIFGGGRQYGGLAPAGHAMSMFETGGEIIRLPRDGHVLGVSATDRLLSGGLAQQAQAQADAMAMAGMIGRGAGGGSMSVNARIINGTGVAASASVSATDNGRGGLDLEVDIQRLVDSRVDRRIGQMGRGRDDAMLAGRFGLKPRLQGG
jgi:hypothetical protein